MGAYERRKSREGQIAALLEMGYTLEEAQDKLRTIDSIEHTGDGYIFKEQGVVVPSLKPKSGFSWFGGKRRRRTRRLLSRSATARRRLRQSRGRPR